MPPATTSKESWKESPDDHDYPAAEDYLSPLTVADGYHRICSSYHLNEGAEIPCRMVDLGTA